MARRSFVRWVSTVALVFATSTGLVVTSAGGAHALDPGGSGWSWSPQDGLRMSAAASGAVRTVSPAVVRSLPLCTSSGPACAVILSSGVLALGAGVACAEIDPCMPWVKEKLGLGGVTGAGAGGGVTGAAFVTPTSELASANMLSAGGHPVTVSFTATSSAYYIGIRAQCRITADGSILYSTQYTAWSAGTYTYTKNMCNDGGGRPRTFVKVEVVSSTPDNPDLNSWPAALTWERSQPVESANVSVQCRNPQTGDTYSVETITVDPQEALRVGKCNPGDVLEGISGATTQGGVSTPRWDIDLRPKPEDLTNYPLCANGSCAYRIFVDGQPCVAGTFPCSSWTRVQQQSPSRVECYYGPYVLPTAECGWLERAYEAPGAGQTVTGPNTDGNPDTYTSPAPAVNPNPTATNSPTASPSVSPKPSPSVSPTPVSGYCASPYNLGPVMPQTAALANKLGPMFDVGTVGGYRESDPFPDHPSGLAADFMTYSDTLKGQRLAIYAQQNAPTLGVDYIMWDHKIWSQARADEGWRNVADRGSPTANHEDHVHITTLPVSGSVPCGTSGEPSRPESESECFAFGWSGLLNPAEFVVKPLKCLFVPRKTLDSRVGLIRAEFDQKGPAKFFTAAGNLISGIDDGAAGCKGPAMQFEVESVSQTMYPFDACADPMKTVASYTHALSWVVIVVGGILAITRAVAMGFGFQFSMGKGGKDE